MPTSTVPKSASRMPTSKQNFNFKVGTRDADFRCSKVGIPYADFKKKTVFYISEVGIPDADFTVHLPPHAKLQGRRRWQRLDGGAGRRTAPAVWSSDLAP